MGASSYYVQLDGVRILFDCGICSMPGKPQLPDFEYLEVGQLSSYSDLDAVVLSHAHLDHIGALPYLYQKTGNIPYFATEATKRLSYLQLVKFGKDRAFLNPSLRMLSQEAINNISECSLLTRYYINKGRENEAYIEFYPAGHCPGAVITKLVTKSHTLCYTGDFNPDSKEQINEFRTDDLKSDILIMNATKGYSKKKYNDYDDLISQIEKSFYTYGQTAIYANNIAKYLDMFCKINSGETSLKFVVEHDLKSMVEAFEKMGYPIYSPKIREQRRYEKNPEVVITSRPERYENAGLINTSNYSLHPDIDELTEFTRKVSPKEIYIVHTNAKRKGSDNIISRLAGDVCISSKIFQCENVKEYEIGVMPN